MRHSELRKCNQRLAQEFGRNDQGEPNFKWVRPSDLFRFIKQSSTSPGGIYIPVAGFEKRDYSDVYGRDCWMLARWQAPPSEHAWFNTFRGEVPYIRNGIYRPVDGSQLPIGINPSDTVQVERTSERVDATTYAIFCIRTQLEKTYEQHLREGKEIVADMKQERRDNKRLEVADTMYEHDVHVYNALDEKKGRTSDAMDLPPAA